MTSPPARSSAPVRAALSADELTALFAERARR